MKVLCISNHPLYRDGLALLIRRAFARLAFVNADTCDSALTMLPNHPDLGLILLDLFLPRHRADTGSVSVLQAATSGVPVVVMSEEEDPDVHIDRVNGNITGFIPKTASTVVFLDVLRRVLEDGPDPSALERRRLEWGIAPGPRPAPDRVLPRLTLREEQVLALLMRGMQNKRIATHLGIASEGTVKQHVSSVLQKLKARNRTEAVVKAVVMGLTPQQPN